MGRGAGSSETEASAVSSRGVSKRVEKAHAQLLADFGELGYRRYADMDLSEQRVVDRDLKFANQFGVSMVPGSRPERVTPYTDLFRYCPNMRGNHGQWLVVNIRFDHESGDIFVVGEVEKPTAFSLTRAAVYSVENAGRSIGRAIEIAERTYEDTFAAFKRSKAGRRASYAAGPRGVPPEALQVLEHKDHPFRDAEAAMVSHLATQGMPARKTYREYVALKEQDEAAMAESARAGFAEVRELGYVD